jgi:hypothetical protein
MSTKTANWKTVSNKYHVLIGKSWNTHIKIVLESFMTVMPGVL